jgi:hypothetical protein
MNYSETRTKYLRRKKNKKTCQTEKDKHSTLLSSALYCFSFCKGKVICFLNNQHPKFVSSRTCSGCGIRKLCLQGTCSNSKTMKIKIQRVWLLWQPVINTHINTNHIFKTPYHLLTQTVITQSLSSRHLSNIKCYIRLFVSICKFRIS